MNAPAKSSAPSGLHRHVHPSDLHGLGRLVLMVLDLAVDRIEAAHQRLVGAPGGPAPSAGLRGSLFRGARATTRLTGDLVDAALAAADPHRERISSRQREIVLAAFNGLFGDLLARSGNPLAIRMALRQHGRALVLERDALAAAQDHLGGKLLVLVHGLCCCDLQWRRNHHDHGAALARDLGFTPLYLHYNSGRHISVNGQELAALLEQLTAAWPVPVTQLVLLGHSMGGLVARSACYYAQQGGLVWRKRLTHMVFLGTPHHGAPLERHGNWLGTLLGRSALTAPLSHLGRLRSAGITDLRFGNLRDEDWQEHDRFAHGQDTRHHVPLPRGVKCYAIAASTGRRGSDLRDRLLGDGLLPVETALGRHSDPARTLAFPPARQWIAFRTHHMELLSRVEVYERIRSWLAGRRAAVPLPPP